MSARIVDSATVVSTMLDAVGIGAIVAFWLGLVAAVPAIADDPAVSQPIIAGAGALSVVLYLGLRWDRSRRW